MAVPQIKVLVVDDSPLMQKVICDIINSDPQLTVVGTAKDGEEALDKVARIKPDVVTLDIEMPKMNGLTVLRRIMASTPLPVIIVSAHTQEGAQLTVNALELGAIDYIPKPTGVAGSKGEGIRGELLLKVRSAALAKVLREETPAQQSSRSISKTDNLLALGASTGGPKALAQVLSALPRNIPPTLIVQHMPPAFTKAFAGTLNNKCKFRVKEAADGDVIAPGQAYLAPGDYHMTVNKHGRLSLSQGPQINFVRPAVDPMMMTAADAFGPRVIGVILTGMGADGAQGIKQIKSRGGSTIAQDEKTSAVYGMPKAAAASGAVDRVLPIQDIPDAILEFCE